MFIIIVWRLSVQACILVFGPAAYLSVDWRGMIWIRRELNLFFNFFVIVCVYVCDNVRVCVNVIVYDYGYEKC